MNYYRECISTALDEVGITATPEQIQEMADFISGAVENYGQYTYIPSGENFYQQEITELKLKIKILQDELYLLGRNNRILNRVLDVSMPYDKKSMAIIKAEEYITGVL